MKHIRLLSLLLTAACLFLLLSACAGSGKTESSKPAEETTAAKPAKTEAPAEPAVTEPFPWSVPAASDGVTGWGVKAQASCESGLKAVSHRFLKGKDELYDHEIEEFQLLVDPKQDGNENLPLPSPGSTAEDCLVSFSGTAERDLMIDISIEDVCEPFLKAGTYTDFTELVKNESGEYGYYRSFTCDDYYPLRWDLIFLCADGTELRLSEADSQGEYAAGFSLLDQDGYEAFKEALDTLFPELKSRNPGMNYLKVGEGYRGKGINPGSLYFYGKIKEGAQMDLQILLRWTWEYRDNGPEADSSTREKMDTLLGNLMGNASLEDFSIPDPESWGVDCSAKVTVSLSTSN